MSTLQLTRMDTGDFASDHAFVSRPEWTNAGGTRCGELARVLARYTLGSTGGPIEHLRLRCAAGHSLHRAAEFLV